MSLRLSASARPGVQAGLKLARLLETPEKDFEAQVRELESDSLFLRLRDLKVVSLQPYSEARFAARSFGGRELKTSSPGLGELLDPELIKLMTRIGQERFEESFLGTEKNSDEERASACGISASEARRIRELVDRLYIQGEFTDPAAAAGPAAKFYSAVAGISIEDGRPILGFFHREIWKGRYSINEVQRRALAKTLSPRDARRLDQLINRLELVDRRKTTLYRVLEVMLETQKDFLTSADPERRKTLTQRALASRINADPSVINRLISNKSLRLPWGLETPMKALLPSSKSLMLGHLQAMALENPGLSDEKLKTELRRRHGVALSRRSIAQYRKELGVGPNNSRRR